MPHSKAELINMNNNPKIGINWIKNIENIGDNKTANIYPTWDAGLSGRMYIALPADLIITWKEKETYNLM